MSRAGVAASEAVSDARVTNWAKTLFARALMVALHKSVVVPNTKICSARPQLYKISTNVGAVVVLVMPIKFLAVQELVCGQKSRGKNRCVDQNPPPTLESP